MPLRTRRPAAVLLLGGLLAAADSGPRTPEGRAGRPGMPYPFRINQTPELTAVTFEYSYAYRWI